MKGSNPKFKFNYLYRDAGNYKQYGSVILDNPDNLSLEEIERQIRANLIDGEFFIPGKFNIPLINSFPFDTELDHEWYEFEGVEETNEVMKL